MPMPNPECGTPPNLRRSRYHLKAASGRSCSLYALQQQVVIANALRAADDLAITLRRQHVNAERQIRALRIGLHVKRLHLRRIAMDHDRLLKLRRDVSLVRRAEISAPLELRFHLPLGVPLLQHFDSFVIRDAGKRRLDVGQFGYIAANGFQIGLAVGQRALHQMADELFRQLA